MAEGNAFSDRKWSSFCVLDIIGQTYSRCLDVNVNEKYIFAEGEI